MSKEELKTDIKDTKDMLEGLQVHLERLERENALSSITKTQREVNEYMIERNKQYIGTFTRKLKRLEVEYHQPVKQPQQYDGSIRSILANMRDVG
ncbi:hypothetical protein [Bacillus paranthracis]|uniref:hypothetical protein n=1 Tax=Bacillus paranthracis TaxID=2026186 RepID=UPI001582CA19|nr:hypothetical protein [Bacillus paranthracis]NUJ09874.1 hypothetical protein [Bacillus paranthracis]NUJ09881.1 hypothetical protein [Bacillus paranthracis]